MELQAKPNIQPGGVQGALGSPAYQSEATPGPVKYPPIARARKLARRKKTRRNIIFLNLSGVFPDFLSAQNHAEVKFWVTLIPEDEILSARFYGIQNLPDFIVFLIQGSKIRVSIAKKVFSLELQRKFVLIQVHHHIVVFSG